MGTQKLALLALGGRATLFYLREINKRYQQKTAARVPCPMLVKKTDFPKINQFLPNQFSVLEEIAKTQLDRLQDSNKIVVPNITFHQAIDRLCEREGCSYPIVHPIKSVVNQLTSDDCKEIRLVSSHYGMNSEYLRSFFAEADIEVTVPSEDDQMKIDEFRKKIYLFNETNHDVEEYLTLLSRYHQDSRVVIACTELSLCLPPNGGGFYDMARAQIDQAMTAYD
ncbi:hypothetical protein N9060_00710 [Arenicella sp.]|nr:hypothetical protein [Arenicella sp.]